MGISMMNGFVSTMSLFVSHHVKELSHHNDANGVDKDGGRVQHPVHEAALQMYGHAVINLKTKQV